MNVNVRRIEVLAQYLPRFNGIQVVGDITFRGVSKDGQPHPQDVSQTSDWSDEDFWVYRSVGIDVQSKHNAERRIVT